MNSTSRSGTAIVLEMSIICSGLALCMVLIADGLYQRQEERRFDQRNAEWEAAVNIMDALRFHREPTLPDDWILTIEATPEACELVILQWPHGRLQTLRTIKQSP